MNAVSLCGSYRDNITMSSDPNGCQFQGSLLFRGFAPLWWSKCAMMNSLMLREADIFQSMFCWFMAEVPYLKEDQLGFVIGHSSHSPSRISLVLMDTLIMWLIWWVLEFETGWKASLFLINACIPQKWYPCQYFCGFLKNKITRCECPI